LADLVQGKVWLLDDLEAWITAKRPHPAYVGEQHVDIVRTSASRPETSGSTVGSTEIDGLQTQHRQGRTLRKPPAASAAACRSTLLTVPDLTLRGRPAASVDVLDHAMLRNLRAAAKLIAGAKDTDVSDIMHREGRALHEMLPPEAGQFAECRLLLPDVRGAPANAVGVVHPGDSQHECHDGVHQDDRRVLRLKADRQHRPERDNGQRDQLALHPDEVQDLGPEALIFGEGEAV
jgi:hypothetical protein